MWLAVAKVGGSAPPPPCYGMVRAETSGCGGSGLSMVWSGLVGVVGQCEWVWSVLRLVGVVSAETCGCDQ
jgi:hypothetical protein